MIRRSVIAFLVLAAACGERGSGVNTRPPGIADAAPGPGFVVHPGEVRTSAPAIGSPHSGVIRDLALSQDGAAALTVDSFRSVRLWPDLDAPAGAEVEPVVVPVRDTRRIAIGGPAGARIVVVIDGAGMARVLRYRPDGSFAELATTPPRPGLLDVDVLPDGKHLLLLTAEHVIELVTVTGEAIAVLDERGYRPEALQLDTGGTGALAIAFRPVAPPPAPQIATVGVRRLRIDIAGRAVSFEGDEREITGPLPGATLAIAPAGDVVAFLGPVEGTPDQQVIAVDVRTVARRTFASPIPFDRQRTLGFIDADKVVVARGASGAAWLIEPSQAAPLPGAPTAMASSEVVAFAHRRRVSALGTTLLVQHLDQAGGNRSYYLGYKPFGPDFVAVSPSGARVAWLSGTDFYLERVDGTGNLVRIPSPLRTGVSVLRLLDDEHLLAGDHAGGLHVIDGRTGRVIAAADAGALTRVVSYDAATRVLVVPNAVGARVFSVDPDFTLTGPYLIDDGAPAAGVQRDARGAPLIWTRDAHHIRRQYTLAEVRGGVSRADALGRGEQMPPATLSFGDVTGRLYTLDPQAMNQVVGYDGATPAMKVTLSGSRAPLVVPAFGGQRFMAVADRTVIEVFDRDGGQLWSRAPGGEVRSHDWSGDGGVLATAGPTGGGVWRGADGEPMLLRCGIEFGRSPTMPTESAGGADALICAN